MKLNLGFAHCFVYTRFRVNPLFVLVPLTGAQAAPRSNEPCDAPAGSGPAEESEVPELSLDSLEPELGEEHVSGGLRAGAFCDTPAAEPTRRRASAPDRAA